VTQRSSDGFPDSETAITLGVLSAVEQDSQVTQRRLATELGIALGLANAYLKRCAKKGLIKVGQAPTNRYAYYLTPRGFAEKSRLTAEYLRFSFDFFRSARDQCAELLQLCEQNQWKNVALFGTGELTEIATVCIHGTTVSLVAIVDPAATGTSFAGLPVVASVGELADIDAVLLTCLHDAQKNYNRLTEQFDRERILTPALLRVNRHRTAPVRAAKSAGVAS
jgi:DNA-binding MarR family transcriptional regulator